MRFRGCFRQCNGKIPLKLNGRPHFCRRSTVLAFCGSPCRVCAGRKPGCSPIAPPGRSWRPSAAVSRPPGGWGCALPSPQTCQKVPATSLGRPLQTAGFSPQGSRPADGFGGRWGCHPAIAEMGYFRGVCPILEPGERITDSDGIRSPGRATCETGGTNVRI